MNKASLITPPKYETISFIVKFINVSTANLACFQELIKMWGSVNLI